MKDQRRDGPADEPTGQKVGVPERFAGPLADRSYRQLLKRERRCGRARAVRLGGALPCAAAGSNQRRRLTLAAEATR